MLRGPQASSSARHPQRTPSPAHLPMGPPANLAAACHSHSWLALLRFCTLPQHLACSPAWRRPPSCAPFHGGHDPLWQLARSPVHVVDGSSPSVTSGLPSCAFAPCRVIWLWFALSRGARHCGGWLTLFCGHTTPSLLLEEAMPGCASHDATWSHLDPPASKTTFERNLCKAVLVRRQSCCCFGATCAFARHASPWTALLCKWCSCWPVLTHFPSKVTVMAMKG